MLELNQAQDFPDQRRNYLHSEMRDFPHNDLSRKGKANIILVRPAPHCPTLTATERRSLNTCVFGWLLSKMKSEEKKRRNKELRKS
jgi:hypothetical protein